MLDFTAIEILEGFSIEQLEEMLTSTNRSIEFGVIDSAIEGVFEELLDSDQEELPLLRIYLEAILYKKYTESNLTISLTDVSHVQKYSLMVEDEYSFIVSSLKDAFKIKELIDAENLKLFKVQIEQGTFNCSQRFGALVLEEDVALRTMDNVVNCFVVEDGETVNIAMSLEAALGICEFAKNVQKKTLMIHKAKGLFSFMNNEIANILEIEEEIPTFL
ncbi:hypothetical protein ACOMCU_01960 [Lysinibacillus sp. UGB7]|uniref:hypothetical protein n=1 Tax=Lysinibacillus sp. UGB7 TaxID=3411039 RepID=UPI003B76B917